MTYNITSDMLNLKGADLELQRYFRENFPEAEGVDYQELLDFCAANDRDDIANWLLDAFGALTTTVMLKDIVTEKSVFVAGSVNLSGETQFKNLRAGNDIDSFDGITVSGDLTAGGKIYSMLSDIKVGGTIRAHRIYTNASIEAKRIVVSRYVRAEQTINVHDYIKAGGDVSADKGISVRSFVESGGDIESADGDIKSDGLRAGTSIHSRGDIVGADIYAGADIGACGNIEARYLSARRGRISSGGYISAVDGIVSGDNIEAAININIGADGGIYAGVGVQMKYRADFARITSPEKPEHIMCGEWSTK